MNIEDYFLHPQMQEPRGHHYSMAYGVFPRLLFEQKEIFLPMLASNEVEQMLESIWDTVGSELSQDQIVGSDGLRCLPLQSVAEDLAASVITFPTPERAGEAIHALILFRISSEYCRYITLEKSRKFLMVCEQLATGEHRNLGIGIKVATLDTLSVDEFLHLVMTELPHDSW